jgi:hypothetical protein
MKLAATIAGIAAFACSAIAGSPELLQNRSFETILPPILGGGFEFWEPSFGNISADESVEAPAQDGVVSLKSFGGFGGTGVQTDGGIFQNVQIPDAAGKTFRASVWAYSPSTDPIAPLDFSDPNGDFGHLPLLLLQFQDANGDQTGQPEVRVFDPEVDALDTWVESAVEGIAPAGTTQINFFCLLITWGDFPGTLFWDNGSLTEVEGDPCPDGSDFIVDDSTAPWEGFMNVFELDGSTYAFGNPWAVEDLTATFDDGAPSVTMSAAEIDTGDAFWYQNGTGGPGAAGNKLMEASMFQQYIGCLNGQTVTFSGHVQSNTLAPGYSANIFIRDFAPDFSSFVETSIPASEGPFNISLATIDDPARPVQFGLQMVGPNVWPGDAAAAGNVVFSSEPGVMGCNAADLAEPFGILDLSDINAFVVAFTGQTAAGDLDNNGIWDLTDITSFIAAFTGGCP